MKDDSFTSDDAAHLLCAVVSYLIIGALTKNNPALRGTLNTLWGLIWLMVAAVTISRKDPELRQNTKAALIMMGGAMCLIFLFRCVSCLQYFETMCQHFNSLHTVKGLIPGFIAGIILITFGIKFPAPRQYVNLE